MIPTLAFFRMGALVVGEHGRIKGERGVRRVIASLGSAYLSLSHRAR